MRPDARIEWETKIYKTERSFRIDNKPAGLLSQAINPDDGVVISLQAYLLDGAVRIGENPLTVEKNAYSLCLWYDYLRHNEIDIFDAHEGNLRDFLLSGGNRYGNVRAIGSSTKVVLDETNLTKLNTIIAFYDFWERKRGKTLRVYRGLTLARLNEDLFTRRHRQISSAKINFSKAEAQGSKKRRPTPTLADGELILDSALEQRDQNRAQTWYLIGSIALRSGSRAIGIESLTVKSLMQGLRQEPAFQALKDSLKVSAGQLKDAIRRKIVHALQGMEAVHRKFIYCDVKRKGPGSYPIAIPIPLCVELIDYICTCREHVIRTRFAKAGLRAPDNVFLSYKVRQANGVIQAASMGNFFKKKFNELEIDGSLQRLRATFAEEVVRDIYIRERALNGRAWQANNVIAFARKLLGHLSDQAIQAYLNNIEAMELLVGEPVLVETPQDVPYVRALCMALAQPDSGEVREALHELLHRRGITAVHDDTRRYALF